MTTRGVLNLMFVCLITVCLIGCGGTSPQTSIRRYVFRRFPAGRL